MWKDLGFTDSPYDARPLRPVPDDVDLLVGRNEEAISLYTALDLSREGVLVLSGPPGVGKTSFLNIQQHLLSTDRAPFGPRLLPAMQLCPIYPGDDAKAIALRALDALIASVETHCSLAKAKIPPQTKKLVKWAKSTGGGFEIGLQLFGFGGTVGRTTTLPPVTESSFESIADAVAVVVYEVREILHFEGALLILDNIENLPDRKLQDVLLTFRDTLFMTPLAWWIIIGQSGLASLIQTLEPRLSDRLAGTGLELRPLTFEELETAIARRVARFNLAKEAKSPLPESIHRELYDASRGEIRFVFKYSASICAKFLEEVRKVLVDVSGHKRAAALSNTIAKQLINNQIPTQYAQRLLKQIVAQEIGGLSLKHKDKEVLRTLYKRKEARASDFREFGFKTIQAFSSNYLSSLYQQHLLSRRQEGTAVFYSLRGIAAIAAKNDLL